MGIRDIMALAFTGSLHPIFAMSVITTVGFTEFTLICKNVIGTNKIKKNIFYKTAAL